MEAKAVRVGWIYLPNLGIVIHDGLLTWNNTTIDYIGKFNPSKLERGVTLHHYPQSILLPPFVNGHTHIPETLLRGLVDNVPLEVWLYDHIWQVEPTMSKEDAVIGTQLGIAEMVSTGTIGFIDQFYYSNEIAQTVADTGVKAFLAPSIFDNNPETGSIEAAFGENRRVLAKWKDHDRIKVGFGPHALYSVEPEVFQEIGELAKEHNTNIHTHVLETAIERKEAIEAWGSSTVVKLHEMGILDIVLAAHVVHLDQQDIGLLAKNKTTVMHNLQSNLKLGSGVISYDVLKSDAINVLIGTDGNASNNNLDMLEELRFVGLVQKGLHHDPTILTTDRIFKMATSNASKVFGEIYSGRLESGQPCDFTIFSLDGIMATPIIRPLSNLQYSIPSTSCIMTVANGDILYKEGKFKYFETEVLKKNAQQSIDRMMETAQYTVNKSNL